MQARIRLIAAVTVMVLVLAACAQEVFNPQITGDQATIEEFIAALNPALGQDDPEGSAVTTSLPGPNPNLSEDETILVQFNNGVPDSSNGQIPGLTLFKLNAGTAGEPWDRNAAIDYTADVVADGTGGATAYLNVDLSDGDMSSEVEVVIDAGAFTANNGTRLLNQDQDKLAGETPDDWFFGAQSVGGGAPVTASGVDRDPNGISLGGLPAIAVGQTTIDLTINSTASGALDDYTGEALAAGLSIARVEGGQESILSTSTSYDGAGTLTFTLPAAAAEGEAYQLINDRYNVTSGNEFGGFIQRVSTNQFEAVRSSFVQPVDGAAGFFTVSVSGTNASTPSITLQFADLTGDVRVDTLTSANLRFFIEEQAYAWSAIAKTGPNTYEFVFPSGVSVAGGDTYSVFASPAIREDNGTPDDTSDDLPLIDPDNVPGASGGNGTSSERDAGWHDLGGTF